MSSKANLQKAKAEKNDEFYTRIEDVNKEMWAYADLDPDCFRGKTVLCPCDDPEWSSFTQFFTLNFKRLGLKRLICTSYAPAAKKWKYGVSYPLFGDGCEPGTGADEGTRGRILVLDGDFNGDGKINQKDLQWSYLDGSGDFRSREVTKLRDEADVIVTNPPFSMFREFFAWLLASGKKFSVIGSMNAITYSEVFPTLQSGAVWVGAAGIKPMAFRVPDSDEARKLGNVCWFTNIEYRGRSEPRRYMTAADNLRYSSHKDVRGRGYVKYENYDAIDVPHVDAIPSDYSGAMGVPITFMDKFSPEQFEIIGQPQGESGRKLGLKPVSKELKKLNPSLRDGQLYYIDADGKPKKPYARILIRNRHPETGGRKEEEI